MTIEVGGISGGISPATSLTSVLVQNTGISVGTFVTQTGCTSSSSITSATLTEVLSITGSGYLTFSGVIRSVNNTSSHKIRMVIDGVEVLNDASGGTLTNILYNTQIGMASGVSMSESIVTFNNSLVVEIAGDGTNGATYAYKRYLT